MGFFGNLIKGVAGGVVGGVSGGISGGISSTVGGAFSGIGRKKREQRQLKMQKELNEQVAQLNYDYGEKSAENAYARQMEMYERSYEDQSYSAMRQQMEDAGLSVGLMYGGNGSGGGQGSTVGAPQGATGGATSGQCL